MFACVSHSCGDTNVLCLLADITNTDAGPQKSDSAESAQATALQARVKELEMEQSLMQHELDNMSEVAQRADKQLRYIPSQVLPPNIHRT